MRYRELSEAPIEDIIPHEMDREGTFRSDDRKKINDPVWKERVIKLFQNSPFPIVLYIVNGSSDNRITMRGKHWIDRFDVSIENVPNYVGIQPKGTAEAILGHAIDTDGKITVMLFQNEGSARVGLTPWIVAHRIAHTFLERNNRSANEGLKPFRSQYVAAVNRMGTELLRHPYFKHLDDIYTEDAMLKIAKLLSGFRSARTEKLRDTGEWVVEMFTEFLIKGKVILNRDWIKDGPVPPTEFNAVEQEIINAANTVRYTNIDIYLLKIAKEHVEIDDLFKAMKGNPLRPRTKAQLLNIVKEIALNDRLVEPIPRTPEQKLHDIIITAERDINRVLASMLTYAMGKVLVL